MSKLRVGDRVRIKKVLGGIDSSEYRLLTEVQTVEAVLSNPLNENPDNTIVKVQGYPYILLEEHVEACD
jgi:hypothetical protein